MRSAAADWRTPPALPALKHKSSAVPVAAALGRYVQPGDFIVACDAGYRNAARLGLQPDLIVGDFDSAPQPKTAQETIVLPHVKDDTDTQYAARWLLEQGYDEITLLGALGGARLEHTLANLATGLYLAKNGVSVLLADERSELRFLTPGRALVLAHHDWKFLSLFPTEGTLTGACAACTTRSRTPFLPQSIPSASAMNLPLTPPACSAAAAAALWC